MSLQVERKNFVEYFLSPASKIADIVSISFNKSEARLWTTNNDNTIFFFSKCPIEGFIEQTIVIPDIKNFIRLLSLIKDDVIKFKLTSNCFVFESKSFSFLYHLLDDSFASKKTFNEDKLNSLEFDTHFFLSKEIHQQILQMSSIIKSAEKLYFSASQTNGVVLRIGDDQNPNNDSVSLQASQDFVGIELLTPIPMVASNMLLLSFPPSKSLVVSINHALKIFRIVAQKNNDISYRYIISGLVK